MCRLARIGILTLALGCRARALGVAEANTPFYQPEPRIRPSSEPFVEDYRFCFAGIENACRIAPLPC